MVKVTSFLKYEDKFEQNHDNSAFERINNDNVMKFTNFNDVNMNYGQKLNLQQVLKNNWKHTIWISAFSKENFFSSVMLPFL